MSGSTDASRRAQAAAPIQYTPAVDPVIYRAIDDTTAQQVIRLLRHKSITARTLPAEMRGRYVVRIPITVPPDQVAAALPLLAEYERRQMAGVQTLTTSFRQDLLASVPLTLVLVAALAFAAWFYTGSWWQALAAAPMLLVAALLLRSAIRNRRRRPSEDDTPRCQNCGYILQHLTVPRCPECGERFDPEILKRAMLDREDEAE